MYNTYIWNRITIMLLHTNKGCFGNRVLVYDGPNSRSKLLADSQKIHDGRNIFTSSLYIISIYRLDDSLFPKCDRYRSVISIYKFKPRATRQYQEAFERRLKLRYELGAENIFRQFEIRVPKPYFINIKINRFVYTGNTEAACYLGGIVIRNDNLPAIGPLCGEVGRLIFEDKRLDGITLSSNKASLIIFLYSGQSSKLQLDIIFSSDKCQGIQNIRDYFPVYDKYAKGKYSLGMMVIYLISEMSQTGSSNVCYLKLFGYVQGCLKMQNFIDSFITNTQTSFFKLLIPQELAYRVKAVIKMVRHERPCRVFNASPYNTAFKKNPYSPNFSIKNATYMSKSLLLISGRYIITTLHDITCAPVYDGVSEILFQILEEQCPNITFHMLQSRPYFFALDFDTPKCSSTTIDLSDGMYAKGFFWMQGYQMNIQVSISEELQQCMTREIYIGIRLCYQSKLGYFAYTYIWKMVQDRFEWTIWDYGKPAFYSIVPLHNVHIYIELYISVKSHSHNIVEPYPNIRSCNQTMRIEHQNNKVHEVLDLNHRAKKYMNLNETDYEHCLLSTCYYLYPFRTNVSWNGAQTLCQQDGMQLLTMNSDIKDQFIENILYHYIYLYFARDPLLFLNMKQDDKVSDIVLCVGYNGTMDRALYKIMKYFPCTLMYYGQLHAETRMPHATKTALLDLHGSALS